MKQTFSASITQEGAWYVAQCLELDVASQGETEGQALASLIEALTLYFEEPCGSTGDRSRFPVTVNKIS